ncbi:hypothetical protein BpHYR1_046745 [Brachionus plicatilis]|uniref:Uncharacterized protein n=1 Tax=Brachionus plicatilis TaxID=10195 RepID=A0A3M7PNN2_BRAPC|nr:hypothetical protein BpHYR1_046745 [Brachionus plicatilis]
MKFKDMMELAIVTYCVHIGTNTFNTIKNFTKIFQYLGSSTVCLVVTVLSHTMNVIHISTKELNEEKE